MARRDTEDGAPEDRTVILDQFGTGTTWGWTNRDDNRLCSGEPVEQKRRQESSVMYNFHNRDD